MKRSKFSEKKILQILSEFDAGISVEDTCRKHGMSVSTLYNWRNKYAGMSEIDLKRLRDLEQENSRLKRMYAELSLDNQILKDVVAKKL
jgi:putative transposase